MFGSVFDPTNGFWRFLARACDVVGLSLCWVLCAWPVFTIGAATTALYDAVYHGVRKGENGDYVRFFRTFKESFKPATLATLPLLVLAVLLLGAWYVVYVMSMGGNQTATVLLQMGRILSCVPLAVWLFAMFTLSRFTFTAGALLKTAFQLVMAHLPSAAVVALLVLECVRTAIHWGGLPLVVLPGLAALLCSLFMERIFAPYVETKASEEETGDE
jgi:uncharacterized membrane protein YesL